MTVAEAQRIWSYEKTEGGTIRLVSYRGREEEVVVPDRIGKIAVTEIGGHAFSPRGNTSEDVKRRREKIRSVLVPEGVVKLGEYTFTKCGALACVQLPDSMTEIGSFAFGGCTSLTDISIPDHVTRIGEYAFDGCTVH